MRYLLVASMLLAATSSYAADLGMKKKPVAPVVASAMCKETKSLPADAFGFATGSDVADLNSWGVGLDTSGYSGYRGATAYAVAPVLQVSGSFLRCLEVGPYLMGGFTHRKAYGSNIKTDNSAFGGGVEAKYKFLGRAQNGVGLTLALSPNVQRLNLAKAADQTLYSNSVRLLSDAELIKGRLFGAFNAEMLQNWVVGGKPSDKTSVMSFRAALTTPVTTSLYLGAEASYQRAYSGNWFNKYTDYAVYVGPTFLWAINDKFTVNGTWAYQIAGESKASKGQSLGIDTFSRNQARIKISYAF